MAIIKHLVDAAQGKHPLSATRSSHWPTVRKQHLAMNPVCAVCGGSEKLEVHHKHSFVEHPELELEPSNLITLCEANSLFNCHRIFGHLNNFQQINPTVEEDAALWRQKLAQAHQEMLERKHAKTNPV